MRAGRHLRVFPQCGFLPLAVVRRPLLALVFLLSLGSVSRGQVDTASPYTFHVYEDLLQVPTLVMTRLHASYPGLDSTDFSLQLDSGPKFRPRHVRLQGNDPVSLAVLLDVSDKEGMALANALPTALSSEAPELLRSEDSLSVFAMDCALVRSINHVSASIAVFRAGIVNALGSPNLHGTGSKPRCGDSRRLWDTMATITESLQKEPGRRVLIVFSDGADAQSINTWESARHSATFFNVTVFAIRPAVIPAYIDAAEHDHPFSLNSEDIFSMLCGESGGIDLHSTPSTLGVTVKRLIDLLRNRYILEFARPSNATTGYHSISVAVKDKHAIIRSSGATFPLQDKTLLNDSRTVPSDPSRAPVFGNRKPLTPPQ